jgi:copper chaperone CopZ
LERLSGVIEVRSGLKGLEEINEVTYDTRKISVETMVRALEDVGTYVGTIGN